jgi:hypothetical protein
MKNYYFLKLNPNRATFAQDMTEEERGIMKQHVIYWRGLMNKGHVVTFGPVLDPNETYGIAIVGVDGQEDVIEFIKHDPAATINTYEFHPMMAIVPDTAS